MTPLMRACELGHEDVVKALLEAEACMDFTDYDGWTPLCYALAHGEMGCARLLDARMSGDIRKLHVDLVQDLQEELLELCSLNAGKEALAALREELAPSGRFAKQADEVSLAAPQVSVPKVAAEDQGHEPVTRVARSMVQARGLTIPTEAFAAPVEDAALSPEDLHQVWFGEGGTT